MADCSTLLAAPRFFRDDVARIPVLVMQQLHRPERLSGARASTGPVADAFPCSGPGCQGVVEASLRDGLVAPGDTCQAGKHIGS